MVRERLKKRERNCDLKCTAWSEREREKKREGIVEQMHQLAGQRESQPNLAGKDLVSLNCRRNSTRAFLLLLLLIFELIKQTGDRQIYRTGIAVYISRNSPLFLSAFELFLFVPTSPLLCERVLTSGGGQATRTTTQAFAQSCIIKNSEEVCVRDSWDAAAGTRKGEGFLKGME